MTWFKVDDSFYDHPKVFDLSDAAVSLWVRAGSWSARNLTNGFVPSNMPARLCGDAETAAEELVHRKMWRRTRGGYFFHDWRDYNPTREDVESGRQSSRERQRRYRERARQKGERNGVTDASLTRESQWTDTLSVTHPTRPVPYFPTGSRRVRVCEGPTTVGDDRPDPWSPPPATCSKHRNTSDPPPCGECRDARMARQRWDAEHADARSLVADELRRARADPRLRCEHGTDGGKHVRSDTGTSLCALCRAGVSA